MAERNKMKDMPVNKLMILGIAITEIFPGKFIRHWTVAWNHWLFRC